MKSIPVDKFIEAYIMEKAVSGKNVNQYFIFTTKHNIVEQALRTQSYQWRKEIKGRSTK